MKKLWKFLLITAVVLVILFYLGFGFTDLFGEWMQKAGLTDQQIDNVDRIYASAMEKVQQGAKLVGKELGIMTGRLAELISGSEEAYQAVIKVYSGTRKDQHYLNLDQKVTDGKGLCSIQSITGGRSQAYRTGINPFPDGSSQWYAYGRFWEDNNIPLGGMTEEDVLSGVDAWTKEIYRQNNPDVDPSRYVPADGYLATWIFVVQGAERIYPHSIAVCAEKMVYVEDVRYDAGVPAVIYYSEAEGEGALKAMTWADFQNVFDIRGYIVPLNIFI